MFAQQTSLQVENPELILADPPVLLEFVSTQQAEGVTFRAIAKKLGVSRQWLYLKVAEAKEKVPFSDKSEDPSTTQEAV